MGINRGSLVTRSRIAVGAGFSSIFFALFCPCADGAAPSVKQVAMAGSGCPASNAGEATVSNDGTSLVIKTPALDAKSLAANKKLVRLNCEATVTLTHAPDLKPVVKSIAFSRSGSLAKGARATVSGKYHYQGGAETRTADVRYEQPGDLAIQRETLQLKAATVKCGTATTISASIAVVLFGSAGGNSELKIDDGVELGLDWQPCH